MSKAQDLYEARKRNGNSVETKQFKNVDCNTTIDDYYDSILPDEEIQKHVEQYGREYDEVNEAFAERTKLTSVDTAFLILATALQCTRQYFTRFNPVQDEKATKKADEANFNEKTSKLDGSNESQGKQGGYYHAKFEDICASTAVPYDKIAGSKKFDLGLGGSTHRYKTIGHDPLLGYIFGTMNILTDTLTAWNFSSYHIRNQSIYSNANTLKAFDSMVNRIKTDPVSVAAALIKQTIHIKSDMYTPNKIPFPIISQVSPELSMTLSKYGLNYANVVTVGKQASLSIAINTIIAMLHRLLMSGDGESDERLYEVRTRKILLCSNTIATSSNIIYAGITKDVKNFDVGGFAVTMYRMFSDIKFIHNIKYEFINSTLSEKYDREYADVSKYYFD